VKVLKKTTEKPFGFLNLFLVFYAKIKNLVNKVCVFTKKKKIQMGRIRKRAPPQKRQKLQAKDRARKVTSKGHIKRKRGDLRMVTSKNVGYKVKQKKGGQWVRASNDRVCKIHTVCDCVTRTDVGKQRFVKNR
jgi:hypothetical protein